MRPGVFVLSAALLLAAVAGQNTLLAPTRAAETNTRAAISTCAHLGAAVQGAGCTQPSLDSTPGSIISYYVFAGACAGPAPDLYVLRYVPADSGLPAPAVATWCN